MQDGHHAELKHKDRIGPHVQTSPPFLYKEVRLQYSRDLAMLSIRMSWPSLGLREELGTLELMLEMMVADLESPPLHRQHLQGQCNPLVLASKPLLTSKDLRGKVPFEISWRRASLKALHGLRPSYG